jgi:hypothetical protein
MIALELGLRKANDFGTGDIPMPNEQQTKEQSKHHVHDSLLWPGRNQS